MRYQYILFICRTNPVNRTLCVWIGIRFISQYNKPYQLYYRFHRFRYSIQWTDINLVFLNWVWHFESVVWLMVNTCMSKYRYSNLEIMTKKRKMKVFPRDEDKQHSIVSYRYANVSNIITKMEIESVRKSNTRSYPVICLKQNICVSRNNTKQYLLCSIHNYASICSSYKKWQI